MAVMIRLVRTKPEYICLFIAQNVINSKNATRYTALRIDGCSVAESNIVDKTQNTADQNEWKFFSLCAQCIF